MDGSEEQKIESARVGYQTAVDLSISEGQTVWAVFNAMLFVNSIIIAAHELFEQPTVAFGIAVLGVVLCIVWYAMMTRCFAVQAYRLLSAREIEDAYLSGVVKTLSRGAVFHGGGVATLALSGEEASIRLPWPGRWRSVTLVRIVIGAFSAVHIFTLFC